LIISAPIHKRCLSGYSHWRQLVNISSFSI
jgi:hypothetical protein